MKAHQLLSDSSKWIRGSFAHDKTGWPVNPRKPDAVCWCAQGALRHCYESPFGDSTPYFTALDAIVAELPKCQGNPIATWNDDPERTFQEVRDLLLKLDI